MHPLKPFLSHLSWQELSNELQNAKIPLDQQTEDGLAYFRGYRDFRYFCEHFFPHYCKKAFSSMHEDFFEAELDPERRGRREVIAAPRGHAKTTFKLTLKTLHSILYGYETFTLIICNSKEEASRKAKEILNELEHNDALKRVYGELAPKRGQKEGLGRWGKDEFTTNNGILIMARSKEQSLRGIKHGAERPSKIICDDVESLEGVMTLEQRQKTHEWFFKDILKLGRTDRTTNFTVIGTRLHIHSLLSELLNTPGWESITYKAIIAFSKHPELWDIWKQLLANLQDRDREQKARAFVVANREAMYEGVEVLWEAEEPYEALMRMQLEEGMASFLSEKQNQPYNPQLQLFDMAKAKKVRILREGNRLFAIQWLDGSEKLISANHLFRIVAFHDPALTDGTNSHYAAIIVVAEDKNENLYCLDAYIEKASPSRQVEKAFELHQKWNLETLYFEDNQAQRLLETVYADIQKKFPNHRLKVEGVTQHQNKQKRISTLEPDITSGRLHFAEGLDPLLLDQLTLFPTDSDDGPDALQGAVAKLKEPNLNKIYKKFYNPP